MKTLNVIHQNGLLFNQESGKRLILKEQCEYVITASSDAFEEVDSLNKSSENLKDSKEMKKYIESQFRYSDIHLLYEVGQRFMFRVGLGKTKTGDKDKVYFFVCRILEDLYAYRKLGSKFPRLCNCHCVVDLCVSENLDHFEPVFGESLNEVSSNTITLHFNLKRSSALNVFNEFRVIKVTPNPDYKKLIFNMVKMPNLGAVVKGVFV
jgi:hypothetical protein